MRRPIALSLFIGLSAIGSAASAAASCTAWMWQRNGIEDRICVDDKGGTYCERRWNKDNSTIRRISCS